MTAALVAVVLLALGLRLGHLASVAGFENARLVPGLDRWLETDIARAVARGDWLGGPLAPYESAPAWALVMGPVYRMAGESWLGPLLVQAVLGALVPLLLYDVGRRLVAPRVGLLAALLAAAYAPAIFYEGLTLKFSLVPFAVSLLLWSAAAIATARHWRAAAVAGGAAAALVVGLRPNAIATLPVVVAWIARARRPAPVRAILLFGLGLLAVAAPLAVRRSVAARRGEAASLWGILFYVGTLPAGDGGYAVVPGVADDVFGHVDDARAVAEAEARRVLQPSEVSAYWFGRGVTEIRRRPGAYLALEKHRTLPPRDRLLGIRQDPEVRRPARACVAAVPVGPRPDQHVAARGGGVPRAGTAAPETWIGDQEP